MQIRRKVTLVSLGLGGLIAVSLVLLYLSLDHLQFFQKNVEFNAKRLNAYHTVKSALLRSFKERIEMLHDQEVNDADAARQDNLQFETAKEDVLSALATLDSINKQHKQMLSDTYLFLDPNTVLTRDDSQQEVERLREVKEITGHLFAILEKTPNTATGNAQADLSHALQQIYDQSFSQMLKTVIDEQGAELRSDYLAMGVFGGWVRMATVFIGGLLFLFLYYLTFIFTPSLRRRLTRLMEGVERLKRGDFDRAVEIEGRDELAHFAATFNAMADEIRSSRASLVTNSKMSALGEMAGGIAHEINNPLGVIVARASQIKRLAARPTVDTANILKFADAIEVTAQRIAAIVSGLRSFSRKADNDPFQRVALASVLEDTLALCTERFRDHGVLLTVETLPEVEFECRPAQIVQILVNLLNNAHDAAVELEDKWVKLSATSDGEAVEIAIVDSGRGIQPAVLEKLFQPFYTTKEIGRGTGLGLSIARGLTQDHKGSLAVDTASPHTRFVLRLPLLHEKQATA